MKVLLEDYITREKIIHRLCVLRIKKAELRQKQYTLNSVARKKTDVSQYSGETKFLYSLFPPRKFWIELNKEQRENKSTFDRNKLSLKIAISIAEKQAIAPDWLLRLNSFVKVIQLSFKNKRYKFQKPETFPIKKDEKGLEIICRPISNFCLKDKLVIGLLNKYLTDLFDDFFYEHSYAFRARRNINGSIQSVSHQTAISMLKEYRKSNKGILWVAECDMKKFYDSVHHNIIKREFYSILRSVKKKYYGIEKDLRIAERLFINYLECYSFNHQVIPLNTSKEYFDKHKIKNGRFDWIEEDMIKNKIVSCKKNIWKKRIGVPQGGALSGLIANIVLHSVDKVVLSQDQRNGLYLRFCDDMIMVNQDKDKLMNSYKEYLNQLDKIKLIVHQPSDVSDVCGKKDFWKEKSKHPFKWDSLTNRGHPWVSFVGYDISHEGLIRIRKKSIKKEKQKQYDKIMEVISLLKRYKPNLGESTIYKSVESRLIGMSVGRIEIWNFRTIRKEMCWLSGFSHIEDNPIIRKQLRELDFQRNHLLNILRKEIKNLDYTNSKTKSTSKYKAEQFIYKGLPFSYFGQSLIYK